MSFKDKGKYKYCICKIRTEDLENQDIVDDEQDWYIMLKNSKPSHNNKIIVLTKNELLDIICNVSKDTLERLKQIIKFTGEK